jgi:HD-like signal output (HDOD) protein
MKQRILFVDDEQRVLDALRRMFHGMATEWDMTFVESGEKAIQVLSKEPFDVMVTDMRMPGMNGTQLLREVAARWPSVVRFVLSGHCDQQMILETVASAHQYLNKPCDSQELKAAILRACLLRDRLAQEALGKIVARLRCLPALPDVYLKVTEALRTPDASLRRIGDIISKDIGMTAKILQIVNSAFFGLPQRVSSPAQAAILLGLDIVKSLMLSVHVFTEFKCARLRGFSPSTLWNHSTAVSAFAKRIAEIEKCDPRTAGDALAAGLLHDAGKVVLAANLPEKYAEALDLMHKEDRTISEAENQIFGTTHAEVGAYLMALWGFPDPVVEALAFHHNPAGHQAERLTPLLAVQIANALDHEFNTDNLRNTGSVIDLTDIQNLGLADRLPIWRDACRSVIEQESEHERESTVR